MTETQTTTDAPTLGDVYDLLQRLTEAETQAATLHRRYRDLLDGWQASDDGQRHAFWTGEAAALRDQLLNALTLTGIGRVEDERAAALVETRRQVVIDDETAARAALAEEDPFADVLSLNLAKLKAWAKTTGRDLGQLAGVREVKSRNLRLTRREG